MVLMERIVRGVYSCRRISHQPAASTSDAGESHIWRTSAEEQSARCPARIDPRPQREMQRTPDGDICRAALFVKNLIR